MRRIVFALGTLLFAAVAQAAPTIALQSGVPIGFALPGGSFTTSYYIDVGDDATQLEVRIDNTQPTSADIDLLLRYGTPFSDSADGVTPANIPFLTDFAQYQSISPASTERIAIDRSTVFPVRAGRWYVAVINNSGSPNANTQLQATVSTTATTGVPIQVVFDDTVPGQTCNTTPWNDPTPKAAVGGNPGTTLGQQRRNALLEAARLLSNQIKSPVPIKILACWDDLGTGNSVTLAQASPRDVVGAIDGFTLDKFLPRGQTVYPIAAGTRLSGASYCGVKPVPDYCSHGEIRATFNSQVDTDNALGTRSFYYGYTPATSGLLANDVDFVSVAMHELTHGLGFTAFVNVDASDTSSGPVGAKICRSSSGSCDPNHFYDDIYDTNVVYVKDDGSVERFMEVSDAERAAALISTTGLRWDDPATVAWPGNMNRALAPPANYIWLYCPNPIQVGSTLSHLGTIYGGTELMLPQALGKPHTLGLAQPMLEAIGWSSAPRAPKSAALPASGLYYDPAHGGHGIGFSRIFDNVYFLAFYTYGDDGAPEWYIAIGPVVDGVFTPGPNANGDDLVRYRYVPNGSPKQQADPSMHGTIRMDFNDAKYAPSCNTSPHDTSGPLAVMSFTLSPNQADLGNPANRLEWCMQALIPASLASMPDYSGTWYAGSSDSGWGFSLATYLAGGNSLFSILYYGDANGFGRWAFVQTNGFVNDTNFDLVERHGYCRRCARPPGPYNDRVAGHIKFTINGAVQNQSNGKTSFDLDYMLPPGGEFRREDAPMVLLSAPPPG